MMRLFFLFVFCSLALAAYPQFPVPCGDPNGASGQFPFGTTYVVHASSALAALIRFHEDMSTFDGGLDCDQCPDEQEGCKKVHDNTYSFRNMKRHADGQWFFSGVDLEWSLTCTACKDKDKSGSIDPFRLPPEATGSVFSGFVPVMRSDADAMDVVDLDETASMIKADDSGEVYCGTKRTSWFEQESIGFTLPPGTGGFGVFIAIENLINRIEWCEGCPPNETGCVQDIDFDPNSVTFSVLHFRGTYSNGDESWLMKDLEASFDVSCSTCLPIRGDSVPPDSLDDFRLQQSTIDLDGLYSITSYPNPVEDVLYLEFSGVDAKALSGTRVEVFNMNGQLLLSCIDCNEMEVSSLPAGMYSLRLHLSNGTFATTKFHKIR